MNRRDRENTYTLGIDYGASNIGLALVRNSPGKNEALFACTITVSSKSLKDKSEKRAGLRSLRRTRKTKKRRLLDLKHALLSSGLDSGMVKGIVCFARKRGYKSLFGDDDDSNDGQQNMYRFSREDFFLALEGKLQNEIIDGESRNEVLSICERILNRDGLRRNEVREIRIDNRGVSRCAWEGCNNVTPRKANAYREVLAQQLVTYFQSSVRENRDFLPLIETASIRLSGIAPALKKAIVEEHADNKKHLRQNARNILRKLRNDLDCGEPNDEKRTKSWTHFEKNVMGILESGSGRNSYCREHSRQYIEYIVAGKQPQFKKLICESDIISRREQILFSKLWRYIEARILPLTPYGINAIVVERTAFDIIGGNRKTRGKLSDDQIEQLYQMGPMHKFSNEKEMLIKEFGGICAYCGEPSRELIQREHILPRKHFFFDSYLNILPACPKCNMQKATRFADLTISPKAYKNFCSYLQTKDVPHTLHLEKKGILNLMQNPDRKWEAERYLNLIANNLASVVQSQRAPRPLARFLYTKLASRQEHEPTIQFHSGRHTALYRTIGYPEFAKERDKKAGGGANHALDAILLASRLPSPAPLENRGLNIHDISTWCRSVKAQVPHNGHQAIPKLSLNPDCVPGFETIDENGYIQFKLETMNWNQKDTATHKQDPYGVSKCEGSKQTGDDSKDPVKRVAAVDLYETLCKQKNLTEVSKTINTIYNPALRRFMTDAFASEQSGKSVADAMKKWLQKSVANSIENSVWTAHPSSIAKKRDLKEFAENTDAIIPPIIGVKRFDTGVKGKIDLERKDRKTGRTIHHYMTHPAVKGVVLVYPKKTDGTTDSGKPAIARIKQNLSIKTEVKSFTDKPDVLQHGFSFGAPKLKTWTSVLENYLKECGFHSYIVIHAGCVLCYEDGTQWFVRNFDKFSMGKLKQVIGIRRTPLSSKIIPLKKLTAQL